MDRNKQTEIERLTTTIREGSNEEALAAVDDLRQRGWLNDTSLSGANLRGASLSQVDLSEATLSGADLSQANLHGANLKKASLSNANLNLADLSDADFTEAIFGNTTFDLVDLSATKGLEAIQHLGPNGITIRTIYASRGQIPEVFLRGCGVPAEFIEHTKGLFGESAIRFFKCFISYSHADKPFTQRLYDRLYSEGINAWLDEHDLKIGDFVADTIDQEIRSREKLIVCCSKHSLNSLWVDREVNTALQEEEFIFQQTRKKVSLILPLDLDGYVFRQECRSPVSTRLRERLVANFRDWRDYDSFEREVQKVIKALRTDPTE